MAFPATALVVFSVYASVMYWYAVPGAGYMPAGPVDVPAWIGELSLALPATATVLYLSMCAFGPKLMAKREAFDPKGFMLVYTLNTTRAVAGNAIGIGGRCLLYTSPSPRDS